jgi:excisionase family DNA binding protein
VSDSRVITVREAAYRLSIAEISVRRMVQRKQLSVVRIGKRCIRIPLEDVDRISGGHSTANAPADQAFRAKRTWSRAAHGTA